MEIIGMLLSGFETALTPMNLLMAALGVLVGTVVGMLPGLGPTSAIAILLPITMVLDPTPAIIMLAGIYYGAMYGGSTTAILLNIPGEGASIPTCLDGYPMAKQGKAGTALGVAAIGSFVAGTLGVVGLVFFAPMLAEQALKFGPPEYFALMILALCIIVSFAGSSLSKALMMGLFGYVISMVGMGPSSGLPRFNYGNTTLMGGFELLSVIIGLFAVTEVMKGLEEKQTSISMKNVESVYPKREDLRKSWPAMLRGGVLGFILGLLPGCSSAVSTFLSYDVEKKLSKHPEKFGKGAIEGVAAPESANNASSSAGFVPLLALGIPASPTLAILLAGLMIYGITPGPTLFTQSDGFVWTVIASMFIGNVMLLVLNLPLISVWAKISNVPFTIMAPIILILSVVGTYTLRNNMFDVIIAVVFGVLGYFFHLYRWPVVPFALCLLLGPMVESAFIESMAMTGGDFLIFFERPISATIMVMAAILLFISFYLMKRTKQRAEETVGDEIDISQSS